jgi:hypothetical protein
VKTEQNAVEQGRMTYGATRRLRAKFLRPPHILDRLISCGPAIDAFPDRLLDTAEQRLAPMGDEDVEIIRA